MTNRRAIKEESKIISRDWVTNLTCRLSHYNYIIANTFVMNDSSFELIRESSPSNNLGTFVLVLFVCFMFLVVVCLLPCLLLIYCLGC